MKRYSALELASILDLHGKWLRGERGGIRADIQDVDITRMNLTGANLQAAVLSGANLRGTNLTGANLRDADLQCALLTGTTLSNADLSGANLKWASLTSTDLSGANLTGAILLDALIDSTDLTGAKLPSPVIDLTGCKVGYKKVWNKRRTKKLVIELLFPEGTKLVSTVLGRKCRASEAVVTQCATPGYEHTAEFRSLHDKRFVYRVGETVRPVGLFDDGAFIECTSGIHFFVTQEEARAYY